MIQPGGAGAVPKDPKAELRKSVAAKAFAMGFEADDDKSEDHLALLRQKERAKRLASGSDTVRMFTETPGSASSYSSGDPFGGGSRNMPSGNPGDVAAQLMKFQ